MPPRCPSQRAVLREVFIFYCSWGDEQARGSRVHLTEAQFLRFCRDTLLMRDDLNADALQALYARVGGGGRQQGPAGPARCSSCCSS